MTPSRHTSAAIAAAAGALIVLTGCSASTTTRAAAPATHDSSTARSRPPGPNDGMATVPPGAKGTPRAGGITRSKINRHDAAAVIKAAIIISARMDTTLDKAPVDAERRATWLMTPRLAAAVNTPTTGGGGQSWNTAAAHHAWSSSTLAPSTLGQDSPSTPTLTGRCYTVTVTWHGTGHWTRHDPAAAWCAEVTRPTARAAWQVAQLTVNPDPGPAASPSPSHTH